MEPDGRAARAPHRNPPCRAGPRYTRDSLGFSGAEAEQLAQTHRMVVWASVHRGDSSHPLHVHEDALVSGVFYASVPSGAAELIFSDPRGVSPYAVAGGGEGVSAPAVSPPPFDQEHRVQPTQGDLLLFPPWLPHRVEDGGHGAAQAPPEVAAFDPSSCRVSVSFNVLGGWQATASTTAQLKAQAGRGRARGRSVSGEVSSAPDGLHAMHGNRAWEELLPANKEHHVVDAVEADNEWMRILQGMRQSTATPQVPGGDDEHAPDPRHVRTFGSSSSELPYGQRPAGMPERGRKD